MTGATIMSKHINLFGYSLWIADEILQESEDKLSPIKPLYSPSALAAYCIFTNLFIGIILYGINIYRRGYLWRGRLFIALSGLILLFSIFVPTMSQFQTIRSGLLLNGPVAISIYTVEKPHFQRVIRHGGKRARWWLPLIWIVSIVGTLLLLQILFVYN